VLLNIRRWVYKRLISKAKFRKWLELEDIRSQITDAARQGKSDMVSLLLCSYLSAAICHGKWGKLPWETVLNDYAFATGIHSPIEEFRIFSAKAKNTGFRINNSSWYSWATLLAKEYGWTLEYIAKLDIEDAISLIQEVLYNEQLRKEWEWALSERAIHYDAKSKTGKFKPLDRPDWMKPKKGEVKAIDVPKTKIRADMIPPGIVIRWDNSDVKH